MRATCCCLMFGLASWASQALAQAPATQPGAKKPAAAAPAQAAGAGGVEAAVRQVSLAYVTALNAGDFKTAAGYWTADGEFVDPSGKALPGRKTVAEELPKRFAAGKRPQLTIDIKSVRVATPDSAVEDGMLSVKPAGTGPSRRGAYNAVWVRQQGKWLLRSIRESAPAALAHDYPLTDLSWLVGDWAAEAEGNTVRIECNWTSDKVYLLRQITVEQDGQVKHSITQRIGLDPLSPKIKSWAFDASGSLSEAFWEKSGDTWLVYSRGASASGQSTSAKNVYSDIGPDGYTLVSVDARVGSATPSDFKIKFARDATRPAPEPAAAGETPEARRPTSPPATDAAGQNTANPPLFDAAEEAAREKILNSPDWRATQQAYHEWLSVQEIYTPAEVKQMRAEFAAKIAKMPAAQLRSFLVDAKEKVAILLSKQADDARLWLAQRMAVEVNLTPAQLKKMRPDIANMTAAQVQQELMQIQQQRRQTQQTQQAFVKGRDERVKTIESQERQADRDREAALNRAYESMDSGSGYYGGGVLNNPRFRGGGGYGWGYRY